MSRPRANPAVRAARLVRGLASFDRRPAYVAALRRRARRALHLPPPPRVCRVCGSTAVRRRRARYFRDRSRSFVVRVCRDCGFVENPRNFNDYTVYRSADQFPRSPRVGSDEQPGRELHMATMAADILGRGNLSVLVVGPGASVDYAHIARLEGVQRVTIGDIVRLHDGVDFVDLRRPHRGRYDVVIASEVIEHFRDPRSEFRRILRLVKRDGIAVCSTNVYDGGNLNRQAYLYIHGHTSYYTPDALTRIASDNRMLVDFRLPAAAARLGPRKRYVLFTRTARGMQNVARYFGDHAYAPSEEQPSDVTT